MLASYARCGIGEASLGPGLKRCDIIRRFHSSGPGLRTYCSIVSIITDIELVPGGARYLLSRPMGAPAYRIGVCLRGATQSLVVFR